MKRRDFPPLLFLPAHKLRQTEKCPFAADMLKFPVGICTYVEPPHSVRMITGKHIFKGNFLRA